MNIVIVAVGIVVATILLLSHRLTSNSDWKATVTPLASIMGSGFLVSAPLLGGAVGNHAVFYMAGLLLLAYCIGDAIRFNIRSFEPIEQSGPGVAQEIAFASRIVLVAAYFVSVSYYLQLLAAFLLRSMGSYDQTAAHAITSCLLVVIGVIGILRGLKVLEQVERFAVSLNLGVIAALLLGLLLYNLELARNGTWSLSSTGTATNLGDIRVVLGLLIVVQGFETSRYIGDAHPAEQRIRTMRRAQIISSAIYLAFVALATILFSPGMSADVTAIMAMTKPVAIVLPLMIGIAAIGSQFSAAVADTAGAGGLLEDLSQRRLTVRRAYVLILVVTVALTWETNVNQIIAYASRAFALFYTLQCAVAFSVAMQDHTIPHRSWKLLRFSLVGVAALLVFALGIPSK